MEKSFVLVFCEFSRASCGWEILIFHDFLFHILEIHTYFLDNTRFKNFYFFFLLSKLNWIKSIVIKKSIILIFYLIN